jgi:uncharacterized coiled-coil protein SlyX
VSNGNEWTEGYGYPNGQNYYYFGTVLQTPTGSNTRTPLHIGAKILKFYTGASDVEAARITDAQNILIGTEMDNGNRLQLYGNFYQYTGEARFGNGLYLNQETGRPRLFSANTIIYQSNNSGDQHIFSNAIGSAFTGTLVTIDPGTYPGLSDSQLALKVWGKNFAQGLSVNMAGRVGVGTMAPTAQLHASGTVRFSDLTNNNSLTRVLVCDANGNLYYRTDSSFGAFNGTFNSDVAINGRVSAHQMLITHAGRWPDYVFSKQYKLPLLADVENFINQNSHLPGIPSAAEVEKKGIDVGSNQAALLKKIEELTLYIIEQDKTIKKQNDQYTELKQEMAELKALIKSK